MGSRRFLAPTSWQRPAGGCREVEIETKSSEITDEIHLQTHLRTKNRNGSRRKIAPLLRGSHDHFHPPHHSQRFAHTPHASSFRGRRPHGNPFTGVAGRLFNEEGHPEFLNLSTALHTAYTKHVRSPTRFNQRTAPRGHLRKGKIVTNTTYILERTGGESEHFRRAPVAPLDGESLLRPRDEGPSSSSHTPSWHQTQKTTPHTRNTDASEPLDQKEVRRSQVSELISP